MGMEKRSRAGTSTESKVTTGWQALPQIVIQISRFIIHGRIGAHFFLYHISDVHPKPSEKRDVYVRQESFRKQKPCGKDGDQCQTNESVLGLPYTKAARSTAVSQ
jgi:hypothetical protein